MAISIIEIDGNSHPLGASAANVAFDGTGAGIEAGTVQDAIEEVSVLAAGGSGVDVVDNLETTDGQKALSAGMGKKLDEKASVVFNHMHWAAGSSSPSVNVGSHERYFCPENHTIYHFYGRIYASEPTTTTLTYQPSKEVVYYDLETATAWRWNGENMVLATYPPYYAIATSSNEGTIDGYNPQYVSDIYPRLVWFSVLRKLAWFYLDGSVRRYIAFDPDPNRVYVRLGTSPKLQRWDGTQWVDVGIDTSTLQPRLTAGSGISINSSNQISVDAEVVQPATPDGTFTIRIGQNTYTVNLNHTHPNMVKIVKCTEATLPQTMDNGTIYVQVDSLTTPQEIEALHIFGLEFTGGGLPAGTPQISSPKANKVINLGTLNGQSGAAGTVRIKGKSLTANSTVVVSVGSGFSLSYNGQTGSSVNIDAADAMLGVDVVVTASAYGTDGTLLIESQTDSILNSYELTSDVLEELTAIKLTGTQWLQSDYYPNPNTEFELDCIFEANANTDTVGGASDNLSPYFLTCEHESDNRFNFQTGGVEVAGQHLAYRIACYNNTVSVRTEIDFENNYSVFTDRSILYYKKSGSNMNLTFQGVSASPAAPLKGNTMQSKLAIGYSYYLQKMFTRFNLYIYGFKIIENGTVVRNYVPAELNGVPGLHDTITDSFISSQTAADVIPIS